MEAALDSLVLRDYGDGLRIVDAANTFRQAVAETARIKTQQTEYGQATAALKNEVEVLSLRDQVDGSRLTQIRI